MLYEVALQRLADLLRVGDCCNLGDIRLIQPHYFSPLVFLPTPRTTSRFRLVSRLCICNDFVGASRVGLVCFFGAVFDCVLVGSAMKS